MFKTQLRYRGHLTIILTLLLCIALFLVSMHTANAQEIGTTLAGGEMMMSIERAGFVWENVAIMTFFDIAFIAILIYGLFFVAKGPLALFSKKGAYFVLFGFGVLAFFHVVDLYIMYFQDMQGMTTLHLQWSWFFRLTAFVCLAIGPYFLHKDMAKPLYLLKQAVVEIAKGNLDTKVDTSGNGAFSELAKAVDKMRGSLKVVLEEYEKKVK